jgi:hypothetical protein
MYLLYTSQLYKHSVGHRTQDTGHRTQDTGHRTQDTGHRTQCIVNTCIYSILFFILT